jgi:methylated-DNA-protein-cysteine methyltransferase related protein
MISVTYQIIYRTVKRIPRGKVATYGQIARLAGMPNQARLVGYAMSAAIDRSVPWYRVINAKGESSLPEDSKQIQLGLLKSEGVMVSPAGKIDLRTFGWKK